MMQYQQQQQQTKKSFSNEGYRIPKCIYILENGNPIYEIGNTRTSMKTRVNLIKEKESGIKNPNYWSYNHLKKVVPQVIVVLVYALVLLPILYMIYVPEKRWIGDEEIIDLNMRHDKIEKKGDKSLVRQSQKFQKERAEMWKARGRDIEQMFS